MLKNNKKNAFTLIEIMFWILLSSIILIISFDVVAKVSFWKIKLIDSSNIEKEAFFFAQRLYETIKKSWNLDYEEYWNRAVVWKTTYSSWHYNLDTGYWNFWYDWDLWTTNYWNNYYYCRSWNWNLLWSWWCVSNLNDWDWDVSTTSDSNIDYNWHYQRYWEYSFQFIDYNSNADDDLWDEDGDNLIIWDEDDEYLWNWPEVFDSWIDVKELYLISADKIHRTFIRLNYFIDPNAPSWATCSSSDWWATYTWTGCLWKIEFLKLLGRDRGMDHDSTSIDSDWTQYDWVIDTWLIDPEFTGGEEVIAWSNSINYWLPLFSNNINVKSFKIYSYPNKDINLAWKDNSTWTNVSPYIRIDLVLSPSRAIKRKIRWKIPEFKYSTTISLLDIYSR